MDAMMTKATEWVRETFARADKDKNGWLSKTELKNLLHQDDDLRESFRDMGGREWKDFWQELDLDGDGKITLDEMIEYFRIHVKEWARATDYVAEPAAPAEGAVEPVLLPDHTIPSLYDLELTPDLERFTFNGKETIEVEVRRATSSITLHARELAIHKASFSASEDFAAAAVEINFNVKLTTVTIVFDKELPLGKGKLSISFTGQLNDQMAGFYRSPYIDATGAKKMMASTQFEAIDARRCFPCWDEPARKAVFRVTMNVPKHFHCLSNMPEKISVDKPDGKTRRVVFADSPLMSTYLVTIVVGEFDYVQAYTKGGTQIRVFVGPGHADMGEFALDIGVKSLEFYEDYFDLKFPLPKLDMAAIGEFAAGAMEGYGLVTFREVDLLINRDSSAQQRQRVATVVTHELAHMWFGDLVTMSWWDNLWLNEGFASFCQNFSADHIRPDFQLWAQFPRDDVEAALRLDALRSSHPIQVPIAHAAEVDEVFDAISYCKGCSVIRMIYSIIGGRAFRDGLRVYMRRHAYSNTVASDLWTAWAEASGLPIQELMSGWTEQLGFPLLRVVSANFGKDSVELEVQQEWFLADGSGAEDKSKTWNIPLFYSTSAGSTNALVPNGTDLSDVPKSEIMRARTHKFVVPLQGASGKSWVKLNARQAVPMRVLYTQDMLDRLIEGIASGDAHLSEEDRAGLVLDAYALAKAGMMAPAQVMKLLRAFANEESYVVWSALSDAMGGLATVALEDEQISAHMAKCFDAIVTPAAARVGWVPRADDGHLGTMKRGLIISLLGRFSEDPQVVAEARKRFDAVIADPSDTASCPSDLRVAVFRLVLRNGGRDEFERLLGLFDKLDLNADKKHVLHSLGFASDPALKKKTLDWATSGAVKLQDFFYPIGAVSSSNLTGLKMAWQYLQDNLGRIQEMLDSGSGWIISAVVTVSCSGFSSAATADEIEAFFKKNPIPQIERKLKQILENVRTNAGFLKRIQAGPMAKPEFWAKM